MSVNGAGASFVTLAMDRENIARALEDILKAWNNRGLWLTMGNQDIKQRYRRSKIGPFWLTISMGVMVTALGFLYGTLFKIDVSDFLPYVACGFVVWGLLSSLTLDGANAFINGEGLIRQLPQPLSIHVFRMIWRNILIMAHNIWIFVGVSLWFGVFPGPSVLWALPGLVMIALNALWIGLALGLLSARFRDIPQIVASLVQVTFFLTPIIWKADMLKGRTFVTDWNPYFHFIELLRSPLLGNGIPAESWIACVVITVAGWLAAFFIFAAYRWRIAYWV
jgi:ABC-2 type transport system permease protein